MTEEVVNDSEKGLGAEKPAGEEEVVDGSKDTVATESEEKEPEDKVSVIYRLVTDLLY